MASKIPVGATIAEAYTFIYRNALPLAGLTWLAVLLSVFLHRYQVSLLGPWVTKIPTSAVRVAEARPAGQILSEVGWTSLIGLAGLLVSLFLSAVIGVAVTEQALGMRKGARYVHFGIGAREWRVFGGYVRFFLAGLGVFLCFGIGFLVALFAGNAIGGTFGEILTTTLTVALLCLAVLAVVRMSFVLTASIVREAGHGGLARSFHLTHGNFWRIAVVWAAVTLPAVLVFGFFESLTVGSPILALFFQASFNDPQLLIKESLHALSDWVNIQTDSWMSAVWLFLSTFVVSVLSYTGSAYSYAALVYAEAKAASAVPAATRAAAAVNATANGATHSTHPEPISAPRSEG